MLVSGLWTRLAKSEPKSERVLHTRESATGNRCANELDQAQDELGLDDMPDSSERKGSNCPSATMHLYSDENSRQNSDCLTKPLFSPERHVATAHRRPRSSGQEATQSGDRGSNCPSAILNPPDYVSGLNPGRLTSC